jgi:hypothetical protein
MKTPHFVYENGRSMVRGGSSSSRFSCGQVKLFRHIPTSLRFVVISEEGTGQTVTMKQAYINLKKNKRG